MNYSTQQINQNTKSRLKGTDLVSGGTHLIAAVFSIFAIYFLTVTANQYDSLVKLLSFEIFGVSMLLLYTASTVYHLFSISKTVAIHLKRLDHMMIYIFIAGSCTPICLLAVGGTLGTAILTGVWVCALLGCLQKIFWIHAPRWISTSLYVLMGWAFAFVTVPLIRRLSFEGFIWLLCGGLSYTLGALIYGLKRPNLSPRWFGFHELFHLFVMLGTFCHFWTILRYLK